MRASFEIINKAVTTAGTPVVFGTDQHRFTSCLFRAPSTNTDKVYVQKSSTAQTVERIPLEPGESIPFTVPGGSDFLDLSQFYADAAVNGERVVGFYVKARK